MVQYYAFCHQGEDTRKNTYNEIKMKLSHTEACLRLLPLMKRKIRECYRGLK